MEPNTIITYIPPSSRPFHPSNSKPISPILPSRPSKVNFSDKTNIMIDSLFASHQDSMAPLPIYHTATTYTFVPPPSHQAFPLKLTPQSYHYPRQRPKSKFIQEKHVSSPIQTNTHSILITSLTEGPKKFNPLPKRKTQPPQKDSYSPKYPISSERPILILSYLVCLSLQTRIHFYWWFPLTWFFVLPSHLFQQKISIFLWCWLFSCLICLGLR